MTMKKILVGEKLVGIVRDDKLIVDNATFNKLDTLERGEAAASFMKETGVEITFRDNFTDLTNYNRIITRLKAGEDVSLELAFNGITVSADLQEKANAYFEAVDAIVKTVSSLIPPYPFSEKPDGAKQLIIVDGMYAKREQYKIGIKSAEKIWNKASPFWAKTKIRPKDEWTQLGGGGGNYIRYNEKWVEIGCQTIPRWEIEELAQAQGWDFPKTV